MLHLLAHASAHFDVVLCATNEVVIAEAERVAPGAELRLLPSRTSGVGAVVDHRRAFRALELDLLQVTLGNPFRARPAMLASFTLRIPTIAVEQLVLTARRRRGRWLKRAWSAPLAAHVVVGERSARDLHRWYGIPRAALTVVHNGVPDEPVVPQAFADRPVVGCAARLEPQKSLNVLVEAMVLVPDARLVIVGEGTCRPALERRAVELGIADRVEFAGWVADARPAIAGFDVFALSSRDDAFPLTIVEAMLSRTPVVATDVGSVREAVVGGITGLLVPTGDASALAAAIRRVLEDGRLRAAVVERARTRAVEHFTARAMAEAYERLWTRTLDRRAQRRAMR